MEILLDIILEFIFSLLFELFAEFFARRFGKNREIDSESTLVTLAYLVCAILMGWLSVVIYPNVVIEEGVVRLLYFVFVPLAVGGVMELRGRSLDRKGKKLVKLDSFVYGYLFALFFIITRYMLVT